MYYQEFYYWCRDAVRKIKHIPDRKRVYAELYDHVMDHYETLVEKGVAAEQAEKMTLEAMGNAEELAVVLGKLHRPFWGRLLMFVRVLACALAIATFAHGIYYLHETYYLWDKEIISYSSELGEKVLTIQPNVSDREDGYTFRVTDATLWRADLPQELDGKLYYDMLVLRIEVTNPLPWAREQQILDWLWAEDSSGNFHGGLAYENIKPEWGYISVLSQRRGVSTYRYELCFYQMTEDAQWITLHYDRAGRDLTLHIDLTGGETP